MRKFLILPVAIFYSLCPLKAAVLPAEKMLPDDTLAMFTIPDFNKSKDVLVNSPGGRLWNDAAMKPFKDKFVTKLTEEYLAPLERDLGVHFSDYTNLLQGQITLATTQNGWQGKDGESPALLFLLDTKDKSSQLKSNLTDLKKKWIDAGKTIQTEKIRDVDFSIVTLTPGDLSKHIKKSAPASTTSPDPADPWEGKAAAKQQLYIGQVESLLILGNSAKAIEKVMASMSGVAVKSLGELPAYVANAGMFREANFFGWINAKTFVDIYGHPSTDDGDAPSASPFALKPDKVLSALGFNSLKTIAFNYIYSPDGAQVNFSLTVPEASRTGLFKILAGEAKDITPPPFVPADAVKFQRWRLDGQKTWTAIRKIVGEVSPTSLGGLDFMLSSAETAAKTKDPNFDLNKNLFGNLGDDIITYQKNPRGNNLSDTNVTPSIFLLGTPDGDRLAEAIKSLYVLYSASSEAPTEREFLGHKINSIALPSGGRSISYTSSAGYLAISSDVGILEEFLRSSGSPGKALRDTSGLTDAIQKVSTSGSSLLGYENESETMHAIFDTLKQAPDSVDPLADLAPIIAATGASNVSVKDWFDTSLLPPFEKVAKYFYFSVYSGSANAEGLNFKKFSPTPPQLKN